RESLVPSSTAEIGARPGRRFTWERCLCRRLPRTDDAALPRSQRTSRAFPDVSTAAPRPYSFGTRFFHANVFIVEDQYAETEKRSLKKCVAYPKRSTSFIAEVDFCA